MTSEEKQEIINAVLAALRTNSKSIDQLTPVSEMSEVDFLELNGGRKVSYGVLFANHMSNDDAQEAWEYLDTHKVDKDSRGLVEVHQATVVYLDAMGNLDGHSLNGSEGLEYRTDTKLIYDFPGGLFGAPKAGAVYISKNNFKKFIWNGTELVELKVDECPLFVDYYEPVSFATLPVGGSYYVPSSHKIAVKIDASSTKTYDPLTDALYFFRDKGKVYTWNSSTNKWVPVSSDINVVNDCTTGGEGDALSAEMGKKIRQNITIMLSRLGNYAFPNGKPTLDWSGGGGGDDPVVPTYTVQKTIGTGLSATGGDSDVAEGDSLEVSIAITDNLYIVDDDSVAVTMGGSPVQGAWDASTMKVTIAAVTGNVVINVPSLTYVQDGLVAMFDGMNRGGVPGEWADFKDGTRKLILTQCTEASDHVEFDGTNSKALASSTSVGVDISRSQGTIEFVAKGMICNSTKTSITTVFNHRYTEGGSVVPLLMLSFMYSSAFGNGIGASFFQKDPNEQDADVLKAWLLGKSALSENDKIHLSLSDVRAYLNGTPLTRSTATTYSSVVENAKLGIFSYVNKTSGAELTNVQGSAYCVRMYNRQLTADEVLLNYKVDQKRFKLI